MATIFMAISMKVCTEIRALVYNYKICNYLLFSIILYQYGLVILAMPTKLLFSPDTGTIMMGSIKNYANRKYQAHVLNIPFCLYLWRAVMWFFMISSVLCT